MEEITTKNGEVVRLHKGIFGWNVVYPLKINNKFNWFNFLTGGSWSRLIFLGVLLVLILLATNEYSNAVETASKCLEQQKLLGGLIFNS